MCRIIMFGKIKAMFQKIFFRNVNAIVLVLPNVFIVSYGINIIYVIQQTTAALQQLSFTQLKYMLAHDLHEIRLILIRTYLG